MRQRQRDYKAYKSWSREPSRINLKKDFKRNEETNDSKNSKINNCYTIKIDSFQSKSFKVVFIKFGPYSDTLIIKRYFIADNYSQILRFE